MEDMPAEVPLACLVDCFVKAYANLAEEKAKQKKK